MICSQYSLNISFGTIDKHVCIVNVYITENALSNINSVVIKIIRVILHLIWWQSSCMHKQCVPGSFFPRPLERGLPVVLCFEVNFFACDLNKISFKDGPQTLLTILKNCCKSKIRPYQYHKRIVRGLKNEDGEHKHCCYLCSGRAAGYGAECAVKEALISS